MIEGIVDGIYIGLLIGILMTFDRLERCHSHAWRYRNIYYDEQTDERGKIKLHDPAEPDTVSDL